VCGSDTINVLRKFLQRNINTVTCRGLCVTYKNGFGLDDWILTPYTFTARDYRQYSPIADLHTLQFTVTHALRFLVFTSRILTTDL
jgi:hypothetical protein